MLVLPLVTPLSPNNTAGRGGCDDATPRSRPRPEGRLEPAHVCTAVIVASVVIVASAVIADADAGGVIMRSRRVRVTLTGLCGSVPPPFVGAPAAIFNAPKTVENGRFY